jgi:ubiquinone biosynthesis accessory factor UbiJ
MNMLASALNRALALDVQAGEILEYATPCRVGVDVRGLNVRLLVDINGSSVEVMDWPDDVEPDVSIRGYPASLISAAANGPDAQVIGSGAVEVRGDAARAQRLHTAFGRLEFDLEQWFATHAGDVVAHQTGNLVRSLGRWITRTSSHFSQDVGDYVTAETGQVADGYLIRDYISAVDELRDGVERVEQKILNAERRLQARGE